MDGPFNVRTILQTCDNWDTDYNSYNWEHKFMRIFVIPDNQEWQWTAFPFFAMFFINIFLTVPSCSKFILLAEGLFLFSVDIFSWFQTSNQQFQESSFASPPAFKSPVFKSQKCLFTSFQITEMFVLVFSSSALLRNLSEIHSADLSLHQGCLEVTLLKTLQELPMMSSVTLNCLVTKIIMNSVFQLSEL